MKRAPFLTVGLLVALQAPVSAQLYNGTPPSSAQFDYVGEGSAVAGTFGVYVGPYTGDFIGDGFGQFSIYCVDYLHHARDLAQVNVSSLAGSLTDTRIGTLGAYQKAAYLSSLFASWSDYSSGGLYNQKTVWSGLHAAIWNVTSGQTLGSGTTADLRDDFLAMASSSTNLGSVDLNEWYVITNANRGSYSYDGTGQEFLMRRTPVPEPAALLLMLTGLAMLVVVRRRRIPEALEI